MEREKSVGGGYENSCHEFRSSRTGHHPKKSHRNFDVVLPCSEATSKTADGARRGMEGALRCKFRQLERLQ